MYSMLFILRLAKELLNSGIKLLNNILFLITIKHFLRLSFSEC